MAGRNATARNIARSPKGRQKRQAQSQRYRCRCAERLQAEAQATEAQAPVAAPAESHRTSPVHAREGQHPAGEFNFFRCERPGCEEWFIRTSHSPCQKFCSSSCRQALRE